MKLYSTEDEICSQKEYYDRCLFQANRPKANTIK